MNYPALRIVTDVIKINRLQTFHLNNQYLKRPSSQDDRLLRQLGHRLSKLGDSLCHGVYCATSTTLVGGAQPYRYKYWPWIIYLAQAARKLWPWAGRRTSKPRITCNKRCL